MLSYSLGVPHLKTTLLLTTAAMLGLSLMGAPYPDEQALQHVPTVVAIVLLAVESRKNWITTVSFSCVIAFIWLHLLGARYIYSFVPYDDWSMAIFGTSIAEAFSWQRNHYDRLVHLCFGALCIVPVRDVALHYAQMRPRWATIFALMAVMTISALYETFEWLLTLVMSPIQAEAYNGQQGDFWDAQKDMALACAGGLLAVALLAIVNLKRKTKT